MNHRISSEKYKPDKPCRNNTLGQESYYGYRKASQIYHYIFNFQNF